MKKWQIAVILFWGIVIGLKLWSGAHGQTSAADRTTEIAGFLSMLIGSGLCATFKYKMRRHFQKRGEAALGAMVEENFLAILFQGILLIIAGGFMVLLKWWLAVVIAGLFAVPIAGLFRRGWPHLKAGQSLARGFQSEPEELSPDDYRIS